MIRVFRAGFGNLKYQKDRIEGAGWKILSIKQSKIRGKTVGDKFFGDWLLRATPKDWFDYLPVEKKIQIMENRPCLR